jgi:hypothetical protein
MSSEALAKAREAAEFAFLASLKKQAEDGEFLRVESEADPLVGLKLDGRFNFDAAIDAFMAELGRTHVSVPREALVEMLAKAFAQEGHCVSADSMVPMKPTEPWGDSPGNWPMWKEFVPAAEAAIASLKPTTIETLRQRRDEAAKRVTDWMNEEGSALRLRFNYQAPGWREYEAAENALAAALAEAEGE